MNNFNSKKLVLTEQGSLEKTDAAKLISEKKLRNWRKYSVSTDNDMKNVQPDSCQVRD